MCVSTFSSDARETNKFTSEALPTQTLKSLFAGVVEQGGWLERSREGRGDGGGIRSCLGALGGLRRI